MKYSFKIRSSKHKLQEQVQNFSFYKKEILRNFRLCTIPLLEFELYFQIIIFTLISPLHNLLLGLLQKSLQGSLVSYQDFKFYALNPQSLLIIGALLLLNLLSCLFELTCLYNIFYMLHKQRKWTLQTLVKEIVKDIARMAKVRNWLLLFWLCIILPVMGNLSLFMPVLRVPQFVWNWFLLNRQYLLLPFIFFVGIAFYFLRNLYLLPTYFVGNFDFVTAHKVSGKLLKKAKHTPELLFIVIYLLMELVKYALPRICYELGIAYLNNNSSPWLIYALTPLLRFSLNFMPFFLQCFSVIISTIIINSLYFAQSEAIYGIVTAPYKKCKFFNCKSIILLQHRIIVSLLCVALLIFYFVQLNHMRQATLFAPEPHFNITAHRGSTHANLENTVAAVQAAIDEGAEYAEIDVQLSKDNEVYLMHDSNLQRLAGLNLRVCDLNSFELDTLLLKQNATADKNPAAVHLAKLRDVLALAKDKIKLNIEFKGEDKDVHNLVKAVCELVKQEGQAEQVVFTSLKKAALKWAKYYLPEVKCGYILPFIYGKLSNLRNYDFIEVNENMLSYKLLNEAAKVKLKVHVWTVNDAENMKRFAIWGVDNIITDNVHLATLVRENIKYNYIAYRLVYEQFNYSLT